MNPSAQVISARILSLVASGLTLRDAWNQVLPATPFDQMVGDLYDTLRNSQAR